MEFHTRPSALRIGLFLLAASLCLASLATGEAQAGLSVRAPSKPLLAAPPSSNVEFLNHIQGHCYNLTVQGHYLYTHLQRQFVVVDVADPRYPVILGRSAVLPDDVGDVAVAGNHAYVADGSGGLQVIDVADPSLPEVVAVVQRPGGALAVAVAGGRAYVCSDGGWYIFDLSDPEHPTELSFTGTPQFAVGVTVVGDYAYFAAWREGLYIIDVSDPAQPSPAGQHGTPGMAHQVAVAADYAYVADDYDGLRIFNVANPSAPVPAGSYNTAGVTRGVALVGQHAYVADGTAGLRVFDVSTVASPVEVGWYDTPNDAFAVAEMGQYVFVADTYGGLLILRYTGPLSTPTPTPTSTPTLTPTPTHTSTLPPATLLAAKFVDKGEARPGDTLQYTLVVMNDILSGDDPGTDVRIVDALPDTLELVPGSLSPEASYDANTRSIHWQGAVPRGGSVTLGFDALLTPASAEWRSVSNTMVVTDAFERQTQASAHTQIILEPTPTETPFGDLTLSGLVYDAAGGPSRPIAGATVSVLMCVPRTFPATADADGRYRLLLPGLYLNQCVEVTLQASADGYHDLSQVVSVADLRAQPERDIALQPLTRYVYLPVVVRGRP